VEIPVQLIGIFSGKGLGRQSRKGDEGERSAIIDVEQRILKLFVKIIAGRLSKIMIFESREQ